MVVPLVISPRSGRARRARLRGRGERPFGGRWARFRSSSPATRLPSACGPTSGPGPGSLGLHEAPCSPRVWRRRLRGSWVGLGCGASTRTPSPSGALRLAAALTAEDPRPVSLIPCPLCDCIPGLGALQPRPIGPTHAEVSSSKGLLAGVPGLLRSYDLGANRDTVLEALGREKHHTETYAPPAGRLRNKPRRRERVSSTQVRRMHFLESCQGLLKCSPNVCFILPSFFSFKIHFRGETS
ncbi:uncharacterized protein LOC125128664 [Phacochoerus africanus]|uniref:uncharacterized protein LOC125128664 n=1 Tax=Phacochoerus africanus TaxID=41426 RepID=UPI001FD90846|nr:uncharacterized protein LOC125128664 [Phacochoerus africanus]